jgi:hypothetical protein
MGNSESNINEQTSSPPDQQQQPSRNENEENEENEENVGFWRQISNSFVYIESVIYIVSHLLRIYDTLQKPNNDYVPHNTPLYISRRETTQTFENLSSLRQSHPLSNTSVNVNIPVSTPVPVGEDTLVGDNDTENECVICTTNKKNTIFIPCGHVALCIHCSGEYYSRNSRNSNEFKCLICKQPCNYIQKIFTV